MANSWNGPQLGSPIRTDVQELQKKLIALLKQEPTSVADIPAGAKRLANPIGEQWQVQRYNGSSWNAIGKLLHDVDKLDGYHAAITPAANTVAVRNADKKLEGDITGNAATASSAATLSETLPVNKGGTGATTSAAARTNLGVPPTSHASSSTTYGLGTDTNYGHVRGDGVTTNVVSGEVVAKDIAIGGDVTDLASKRGQIGDNIRLPDTIDLNTVLTVGFYGVRGSTVTNSPSAAWGCLHVMNGYATGENSRIQIFVPLGDFKNTSEYIRTYSNDTWSAWVKTVMTTDLATASTPGIVKPGTGMSVDSAGSLGVDDTVVRTTGDQTVAGAKTFTYSLYSKSNTLIRTQRDNISISDTSREAYTSIMLAVVEDKDKKRFGGLEVSANTDGSRGISLVMRNRADTGWLIGIRAKELVDGTSICEAPNPGEDSNSNHIATTRWVRNYALPISSLIPSLAASMPGYLLCNGAAVSRTTYANLFSIIGTAFGEGDGSTTFNLPDFRNKTLWGANNNLGDDLEAGLPNATGKLDIISSSGGWDSPDNKGALYAGSKHTSSYLLSGGNGNVNHSVFLDLSKSNTIYGKSTTVQPPAIAVNIFIKY